MKAWIFKGISKRLKKNRPILKNEDYRLWNLRNDTQRMLSLESEWLKKQLSQLHGKYLMYHGLDTKMDFLSACRIPYKFSVGLSWQQGLCNPSAVIESDRWPISDQSLDVVVLQHSLDYSHRPHQMISEATRVLDADGSLVLVGFNPWSLWGGLNKIVPCSTNMFSKANMVSLGRLQDWLALLGYSVEECVTSGYFWPLEGFSKQTALSMDQKMTSSAFMLGNLYFIVAKKNTFRGIRLNEKSWASMGAQYGWVNNLSSSCLDSHRLKSEKKHLKDLKAYCED